MSGARLHTSCYEVPATFACVALHVITTLASSGRLTVVQVVVRNLLHS